MSRRPRDPEWEGGWALTRFTRLVRDLSTIFPSGLEAGGETGGPQVDLLEREDAYLFLVEAPGLSSSDIKLSMGGGLLVVEGYKRRRRDPGCLRFLCLEREYGYFKRKVEIPGPVDTSSATAELKNGLLVVVIPRVADRRRERTTITISD
jgi:HSP20 family protein